MTHHKTLPLQVAPQDSQAHTPLGASVAATMAAQSSTAQHKYSSGVLHCALTALNLYGHILSV